MAAMNTIAAMNTNASKSDPLSKLQTPKREELCNRLRTFLRKDKRLTDETVRGFNMKQRQELAVAFLKADSPGGPAGSLNGSYFWNRENTAGSMDYLMSNSDSIAIERGVADFIRKDYAIKPAKSKRSGLAAQAVGPSVQQASRNYYVVEDEDPLLSQELRKAAASNERLERADSTYAASESDHVADTNRELRRRNAAPARLGLSTKNLPNVPLSNSARSSPTSRPSSLTHYATISRHDDEDSLFMGSPWSPAEDIPHTPRTPPPSEKRHGKRKAVEDDGSTAYPTPSGNDSFERDAIRTVSGEVSRPAKTVRVSLPQPHPTPAVTNTPVAPEPVSSPSLNQTSAPAMMGPPLPSDVRPPMTGNGNVETVATMPQEAFNPPVTDFTAYLPQPTVPAQSPVSVAPPSLARGTDLVQSGARLYRISDLARLQEQNFIHLRQLAAKFSEEARVAAETDFGGGKLKLATLCEDIAFEFELRARRLAYRANLPRQ